jgi:hypothetical protein
MMTPLGVSHALEMHEYPMDETPIKRKMKLRIHTAGFSVLPDGTLRKFGDWSLDAPTVTITGNNSRAVWRSAQITMKRGGYWHHSGLKNKKSIHGWPTITLDRIERRRGKV